MPERLHPGVYVEEVSSGVKPVEGVGTSTAAFLGEAARGIPAQAHFLTSFAEYERALGSLLPGERGLLGHAVAGFFAAGGKRAYVVRVLPANARKGQSDAVAGRGGTDALQFVAKGAGIWSSNVRIAIGESSNFKDDAFRVDVLWSEGGATRRLEVFDDVRMDPSHEDYVGERMKTSRYVEVVDLFAKALDVATPPSLLAAEAPVLRSRVFGATDKIAIPDKKRFAISGWNVGMPDATPTTEPVEVDGTTVAAVGGPATATNGYFELTASQLASLIAKAAKSFKVATGPTLTRLEISGKTGTAPIVTITPPTAPNYDLSGQKLSITINGRAAVTLAVPAANAAATTAAEIVKAINDAKLGITAATTAAPGGIAVTGAHDEIAAPTLAIASTPTAARMTVRIPTAPTVNLTPPAGTTYDLGGQTIALTVNGAAAVQVPITAATPAATTGAELAKAINDAALGVTATAGANGAVTLTGPFNDAAAPALVAAANPTAARVTVAAGTAGVQGTGGVVGPGPDKYDGLRLSISETITTTAPAVLRTLGFPATSRGYAANSPANPALRPAVTAAAAPIRVNGGEDGSGAVTTADYIGDARERTGLHALDTVDVNLVAIPGKNDIGYISAGITYCDRRGDCFFLADGPGSSTRGIEIKADEARNFVDSLPTRSKNAAMFFPWIQVPDPTGIGRNPTRFVAPSGHVAGIFARTDITRGVWKAPAGIEATVPNAVGLQAQLLDADQDLLNPASLNCLRQFPGVGIVSWGTRTLGADPEWRYVPVRRMGLFLKESLRRGLQWAVFEPNDEELWGRIKINIEAFMMTLFRQGAFQGATPDEAFAVQCDRETNPQVNVDAGIVTAKVAFAPLKPAEFVVIEISQKSLLVA